MSSFVLIITFAFGVVIGEEKNSTRKYNARAKLILEGLKLKGDVKIGKIIYLELCLACHLPAANGDPSGAFPQVAGQHSTVGIKQMADIWAGNRDNPTMFPFANYDAIEEASEDLLDEERSGVQVIADMAAYIQSVPMTSSVIGEGKDLANGKKLFEATCTKCHGDHGQGSFKNHYPVLTGQNYNYLVRQFKMIKDGKRRNANPEMVKIINDFKEKDIKAIMDFLSRQKMRKGDWDPNK